MNDSTVNIDVILVILFIANVLFFAKICKILELNLIFLYKNDIIRLNSCFSICKCRRKRRLFLQLKDFLFLGDRVYKWKSPVALDVFFATGDIVSFSFALNEDGVT